MPLRPEGRPWLAAGVVALALVAACGPGGSSSDKPVVEVFGPIVGAPAQRLGHVLQQASAGSPVELRYIGVSSFNEQLDDRLDRGDRPGVVLLPQPGVLSDLAARGLLRPLPDAVAAASRQDFPAGLVDLVSIAGRPVGVWLNVDVKGLVWYRPSEFARRGLSVPTSLDELAMLSAALPTGTDAVAPWCVAMEDGAATGWVGTDWVESYVLRRLGPSDYDRWTSGQLPFDSPQIEEVFSELDALLRTPGAVSGGRRAVLTTSWDRVADGLLAQPPSCLMVFQADFLRRELPSGTTIGPDGDVDFFVLPSAGTGPAPLLIGGSLAAPMGSGTAVDDAMEVLASSRFAELLDRTSDFLSPHLHVPSGTVGDPISTRLLNLVTTASTVRFDGADLMPAEVGTGTFWTGMRSFFGGEQLDAVLAEIQAGWSRVEPPPG